jgi:Family of unknown function (DUF6232)
MRKGVVVSPNDVTITPTFAKFGNTSYPISAINSVSIKYQTSANETLTAIITLFVICTVAAQIAFAWTTWVGVGIAVGIIIILGMILRAIFRTRTATLILATANGNVLALVSRDVPGVEGVKDAIEQAFSNSARETMAMPSSKEILKQQNAESKKARRKERFYLICGLVIAAIAEYGAAMLGTSIEGSICEVMHNDFGYPKQFYNAFILCGAVNKEPWFTAGVIVFVIAAVIAFKAIDGMYKERVARQSKIYGEQLERELQADRGKKR